MGSPGNARKPQIWPVSLSQNCAKIGHKLISSEDGQDTSACKIAGHSLHAFSGKCPETSPDGRTDRRTDGRTDGRTCHKTVTVGRVDQRTHVQVKRGYFGLRTDGRTDRRTDRQPENIMPPAPKGGGIKSIGHSNWTSRDWPLDVHFGCFPAL